MSQRTFFTSSFSVPPPALLPASQAYEPLVKAQLKHRLTHVVFVHSAAFSLALHTFLASSGGAGLFASFFTPRTWFVSALAWALGVFPVIVLRKIAMRTSVTTAPSPKKTIAAALSNPAIHRSIAVYLSSAVAVLALHLYHSSPVLDGLPLGIFVKSRKHPYYLNGSFVFLLVAQIWFALSFSLRNVMRDRFVFRWIRGTPSTPSTIIGRIPVLFITIALFTLLSLLAYNLAFGLFRMFVLPFLLRVPLLRAALRPFTLHFLRGPWTIVLPLFHLPLQARTFILGFTTLASWEFAEILFEAYIPQPVKVTHVTADQNVTLISGVTSADPVFLHFAYSELRALATDDTPASSARRSALFSEQKHNPTLWVTLVRTALLRLGQDYQTLLRRGEPLPPPLPAPAPPPRKLPDAPQTPILRQPINRPLQQSPLSRLLDAFASDSDLSKATEQVSTEVETLAKDAGVPELFRSVAIAPPAISPPSVNTTTTQEPSAWSAFVAQFTQGCRSLASRNMPAGRDVMLRLNEWWTRERIYKRSEMSLPNSDLDALIIESLSALVCASLAEDRYGVVQRDIPRILEAFISFLYAVEDFQAQVRALYVPPTPEEVMGDVTSILQEKERTRVEVAKAMDVMSVVGDALRTALGDIVRTFGHKLSAFKFPPKIARKLQTYVDYI